MTKSTTAKQLTLLRNLADDVGFDHQAHWTQKQFANQFIAFLRTYRHCTVIDDRTISLSVNTKSYRISTDDDNAIVIDELPNP